MALHAAVRRLQEEEMFAKQDERIPLALVFDDRDSKITLQMALLKQEKEQREVFATKNANFKKAIKEKKWDEVERFVDDVIPTNRLYCDFALGDYCTKELYPPWPLYAKLARVTIHPPNKDNAFWAVRYFYGNPGWCLFEELVELFHSLGVGFNEATTIPLMIGKDALRDHFVAVTAHGARYRENWKQPPDGTITHDAWQKARLLDLLREGVVLEEEKKKVPEKKVPPPPSRWCWH